MVGILAASSNALAAELLPKKKVRTATANSPTMRLVTLPMAVTVAARAMRRWIAAELADALADALAAEFVTVLPVGLGFASCIEGVPGEVSVMFVEAVVELDDVVDEDEADGIAAILLLDLVGLALGDRV